MEWRWEYRAGCYEIWDAAGMVCFLPLEQNEKNDREIAALVREHNQVLKEVL